MKPVSPVVEGFEDLEVVYAKDQPEYIPLPALPTDGGHRVTSRWKLSWRERLRVLWYGDIWLSLLTFGDPLQPIVLATNPPEIKRQ